MEGLAGKVAVVTGGAGGIGRAMGEHFAAEQMRVVLADVEPNTLDTAVSELQERGLDIAGVVVDVADYTSVEALRDKVLDTHGAVHVLCNNAGIGAGAKGQQWDHDLDRWQKAMGVNVWGVIHGIKAFVPVMVDSGEEGHIVNTSSGNGGISPLASTAIYAMTKAAVVTLTETLYAQLQSVTDGRVTASVLFPGPHILRTGLLGDIESFEMKMRAAGVQLTYTPVEEVAERVVAAIRTKQFWILPEGGRSDEQIRARSASMLARSNPTYVKNL